MIPFDQAIAIARDLGLSLADAETLARLATDREHALDLATSITPPPSRKAYTA
jgi:hypothetical protein